MESEAMIGGGEGAAEGIARAVARLGGEEGIDGFLEAAVKELFVAVEGDVAAGGEFGAGGQVEAVEGGEEEEGADAIVEVVLVAAEMV